MNRHRALPAAAGLLIAAGLPPWGWWPSTIVGLAVWYRVIDVDSGRTRFLRSLAVGAVWAFPSTLWMYDLTAIGWPLYALIFSVLVAVAGWLTPAERPSRRVVFPAAVALVELIRWSVPFGGVPIATLAMTAVATPWAITARLFGSPFLVLVTVTIAVAAAEAVRRERAAALLAAAVIVAILGGMVAGVGVGTVDEIRVAVVQGGGPQNTRADRCENRAVFERHMAASQLIDTAEPVDLILWPENVVNPSPDGSRTPARCDEPLLLRTEAVERLQALAVEKDAVVIVGWFERAADNLSNENYSVVFGRDGTLGDRYDKVRLVPFGEFVPLRSFIEMFSSEVPGVDVRAGTDDAVIDTELGPLGVSISWEIFFDVRARDAIGNGGQVLLNPTNGSSYWLNILQSQQVASSRLRALETDRWVLQAAPTGFSAVVDPDGTVHQRTGISEQGVLRQTIELREGRTPAVALGAWPVLIFSIVTIGWSLRSRISPKDRVTSRSST